MGIKVWGVESIFFWEKQKYQITQHGVSNHFYKTHTPILPIIISHYHYKIPTLLFPRKITFKNQIFFSLTNNYFLQINLLFPSK